MSHKCGCARPQIIIHFEMFGLVWLAIEDHETCMILQVGCVCFFNPFVVYSFGLCTVNLFMHVSEGWWKELSFHHYSCHWSFYLKFNSHCFLLSVSSVKSVTDMPSWHLPGSPERKQLPRDIIQALSSFPTHTTGTSFHQQGYVRTNTRYLLGPTSGPN